MHDEVDRCDLNTTPTIIFYSLIWEACIQITPHSHGIILVQHKESTVKPKTGRYVSGGDEIMKNWLIKFLGGATSEEQGLAIAENLELKNRVKDRDEKSRALTKLRMDISSAVALTAKGETPTFLQEDGMECPSCGGWSTSRPAQIKVGGIVLEGSDPTTNGYCPGCGYWGIT